MNYGLIEGDVVVAVTRFGTIERGDLLVIRHPEDPQHRLYVKRCVALPGDRYFIRDRRLYLQLEHNATLTARTALQYGLETVTTPEGVYLKEPLSAYYGIVHNPNLTLPKTMTDHTSETIPKEHYYTMGDYRDNSADSRIYGPVPRSWITARIVAILKWPRSWQELIAIEEAETQ
jgi:signal peptidase I